MQQQLEQRQQQLSQQQQEMNAKAESAAKWAKFRASIAKWPLVIFALVFFVAGIIQRRLRWNDLLDGIKWHTRSRGVPTTAPLLKNVLPETYVLRFVEPLGVFLHRAYHQRLIAAPWLLADIFRRVSVCGGAGCL